MISKNYIFVLVDTSDNYSYIPILSESFFIRYPYKNEDCSLYNLYSAICFLFCLLLWQSL